MTITIGAQAPPRTITGRVVRAIKSAPARGMVHGRVYVEAYLPFDPEAFGSFVAKAAELGGGDAGYSAAAAAFPELASKALEPIDAHGEAMLAEDVEALAEAFMTECRRVDVQHDQVQRKGVAVVQSFVNGPEIASPLYWPGAWVVVLKIEPDAPEFALIDAGALNAVSFQAIVTKVPVVVQPKGADRG